MRRAIIAAAVALALPGVALAKKDEVKFVTSAHVPDKPAVQFDPAKAYVLLRSEGPTALYLMKAPSDEDATTYARLRAEALAESRERYAKKLASYEEARKAAATTPSGSPRPTVPDKPVEPTEQNFQFTPFGMLASVAIGPINRFAKGDKGASTYLEALTPGRYRFYGPVSGGANGAMMGVCYCMGSVSFDAKAGEVVDLGLIAKPDVSDVPDGMAAPAAQRLQPAPVGAATDPRLAKLTITPARYRPVGKIPNYFGLAVTRMPEMAGVMRYDRDRIVDLTGGN